MSLTIGLYDPETKRLLEDITSIVKGVKFTSNEQGFELCQGDLEIPVRRAFRRYEMIGVPDLIISDQGLDRVWEGRLEDFTLRREGSQFRAFGHSAALRDLLFTGVYSSQAVADWEIEGAGVYRPELYYFDQNNRLYIAPSNGETIDGPGIDVGAFRFEAPHQADRRIYSLSFSYELDPNGNDWGMYIMSAEDWDYTQVQEDTVHASSSPVSGTKSYTWTGDGVVRIWIELRNRTSTPITISDETGTTYLKITNLRIMGMDVGSMTGDLIVSDLLSYIRETNPYSLAGDEGWIFDPGPDNMDLVPEDTRPADIIRDLADQGDDESQLYKFGVWDRKQIYFWEKGYNAQTWYADVEDDLALQRTISAIGNRGYVSYRDQEGRVLRTERDTADLSIRQYGLTLDETRRSRSTSESQAELQRDLLLLEASQPTPRSRLVLTHITNKRGAYVPIYKLRAGDTINLRNLPVTTEGDLIDRVRTMTITETDFNTETGQNQITLEASLPDLGDLIFEALARPAGGGL